MKTLIRTTIKGNNVIYTKETLETLSDLLSAKGGYMIITKRRYNNQNKILSERKAILKKSTIVMIDKQP